MIFSMTGYGKAEQTFADKTISIELRSLNSKQMDISLKLPTCYKERELPLRNLLTSRLERGKVDCCITRNITGQTDSLLCTINQDAITYYYNAISQSAKQLGIPMPDSSAFFTAVLRIPQVTQNTESTQATQEELAVLDLCIEQVIERFNAFREQEGAALQNMFDDKLSGIQELLASVDKYEKGRIENIRQRLEISLQQLSENSQVAIDRNRLEQEMIYYLEKLDITEEKVRLSNHIRYFRETMSNHTTGVGKKLGFIAQEMGREINTLGSKSNQSEMQIIVVQMKDLLEQIKEQVLNVL